MAGDDGCSDAALQLYAVQRGVAAQGCEIVHINRPEGVRVKDDYIGRRAGGQAGVRGESVAEHARRPDGQPFNHSRQTDMAGVNRVEQRPQRGFQDADAECGVLVSAFLAGRVVGRMVGGDAVNDAVGQPDDAGGYILRRPQRWIYFRGGVVGQGAGRRPALAAQGPILGKHQMMGADFGGKRLAAVFGGAH